MYLCIVGGVDAMGEEMWRVLPTTTDSMLYMNFIGDVHIQVKLGMRDKTGVPGIIVYRPRCCCFSNNHAVLHSNGNDCAAIVSYKPYKNPQTCTNAGVPHNGWASLDFCRRKCFSGSFSLITRLRRRFCSPKIITFVEGG